MPKRKKYPRIPNGMGSIRFIGKHRKNPYAVHPPATQTDEHGNYIRPRPICYVDDWYVGFAVLNAYHAGTYKPGDEILFKSFKPVDSSTDLEVFCNRLLADFSLHQHADAVKKETDPTFAQVYEKFYDWKFGENAKKKLSPQLRYSIRAAYNNCSQIHNRIFRDLQLEDLQQCLDSCTLKRSSLGLIMMLFSQMYKFAVPRELCDKNYAPYLVIPDTEDNEHGVPFSDADLAVLWAHKNDPVIEFILIMCYSGFRISAYKNIHVDTQEWYFEGGIKTAAGKNRIVPIHTAIRPLVTARLARDGCMLKTSTSTYRQKMYMALEKLSIERHTPHDCRHTFSRLCEKYKMPEADRKRMMGHSFGADLTNGTYGHRTLDELRESIEMIEV